MGASLFWVGNMRNGFEICVIVACYLFHHLTTAHARGYQSAKHCGSVSPDTYLPLRVGERRREEGKERAREKGARGGIIATRESEQTRRALVLLRNFDVLTSSTQP